MNVSDIIVARSGAMTITEISIVGKPAIFIPLPSNLANRQEDNARVFEKNGAAKIILNNLYIIYIIINHNILLISIISSF